MKVDKNKKIRKPDLRRVKGTVLFAERNTKFLENASGVEDAGQELASPNVGVLALGQTTHE